MTNKSQFRGDIFDSSDIDNALLIVLRTEAHGMTALDLLKRLHEIGPAWFTGEDLDLALARVERDGKIVAHLTAEQTMPRFMAKPCPDCNGSGRVETKPVVHTLDGAQPGESEPCDCQSEPKGDEGIPGEVLPAIAAPIALTRRGTDEVIAWACGFCGEVARDEQKATACCVCVRCGGQARRGGWEAIHDQCKKIEELERFAISDAKQRVKDARALLAATPIAASAYPDPVLLGDDEVVEDAAELIGEEEYGCHVVPAYVYGTHLNTLCLDDETILSDAFEQDDMRYDGVSSQLSAEARRDLELKIDAWNEKYGSTVVTYTENRTNVIVIDQFGYIDACNKARVLLTQVAIVKAFAACLYLLKTSQNMLPFAWQYKGWLITSSADREES